ncbi:MAG: methyltransferase domain-containing protein [Alphaproteobacteria bacterium]|nr:methyltransferase domain-containing protein [Alphaproteobacteria bacterium]
MTCFAQMEAHNTIGSQYQHADIEDGYIGDLTYADYRRAAEEHFSFMLPLIDPSRVAGTAFRDYVNEMNEISWEFEDQDEGGRGVAYNLAQRNSRNRIVGTLSLLRCFSKNLDEVPGSDKIILDALAGDGTITRLLQTEKLRAPTIISSDLSSFMVKACIAQKYPCIRQSATYSLLRDSVLDGVLIAYGSHHLDNAARKQASLEAYRTLKVGGRFVLHDFETGAATANWFDKVVHPFSRTGHPHRHFTRDEMQTLLQDAGLKNIQVFDMADPFILEGTTPDEARVNALMHVYRMYDLVRVAPTLTEALHKLETCVNDVLGGIHIEQTGSTWTATIERQALVAVGTKVV